MAEIGVPAGLAGLFEPNAAEVQAAQLNRPFLIGAYGLDRIAGRQQLAEMADQTNVIKTMLALRKMKQERLKDVTSAITKPNVTDRFERLAPLLKLAELDLPEEAAPGWPGAKMAQMRKPSGSINLGDETNTEESLVYRNVRTGQESQMAPPGGIESGEWQAIKKSRRVKTKGVAPGVPSPPTAATPKAAPEVKVPPGVKRGETFKGPDGRTYRAQ